MSTPSLHRELLSRLAARQPSPTELPLCAPVVRHVTVIEWSPSFVPVSAFFRCTSDDRVLATSARCATDADRDAIAHWLSSLDEAIARRTTESEPTALLDGATARFGRFDRAVVIHPSQPSLNPSKLTTELLAGRTFRVHPCFRSEFSERMEPEWARVQLRYLRTSDLDRAPHAAFRLGRSASLNKPAVMQPAQPRTFDSVASLAKTRDVIELENPWRRRLRLHRGHVEMVTTGEERPLAGLTDARDVVRAFVEEDTLRATASAPDALVPSELWDMLEASSGDVSEGVEPVTVDERSTRRVVARLFVRLDIDTLRVEYQRLDPRLTDGHIRALLEGPYLHTFTRHHWRAKAKQIALCPRNEPGPTFEYAYPTK